MKKYCVYLGDTHLKSSSDECSALNLVNSLSIFCVEHDVDYSIKIERIEREDV